MKVRITLLALLLIGQYLTVDAQTVAPQLVGSGGNNLRNIQGSLSFSVGEAAVTTIRSSGSMLTQGFQQSEIPFDTVCRYFAPDAFTPSLSTGLNDFFRPISACQPQLYELVVYNRWGKGIFRTVNPNDGWDGTENGEPAPAGTYLWRLSYRIGGPPAGVTKMQGEINLLR